MPNHQWTIVEGDGPEPRAKRGKYAALWDDVILRLEKTPRKWLHIFATDAKATGSVYDALLYRANKLGEQVVEIRASYKETIVYIRRGPNWGTRDAGALSHLPAHPEDAPSFNNNNRKRKNNKAKAEVHDFD